MPSPYKFAECRRSTSAGHLQDLHTAHANLVEWMDRVDALTDVGTSHTEHFSAARWNLSKARQDWRWTVDSIQGYLQSKVDGLGKADLQAVVSASNESLRAASAHISAWSPKAILENPSFYRRASLELRTVWIETIELERRLLVPLLEKHS